MKASLLLTHKVNQLLKHYSQTNVPREEVVIFRKVPEYHGSKDREE